LRRSAAHVQNACLASWPFLRTNPIGSQSLPHDGEASKTTIFPISAGTARNIIILPVSLYVVICDGGTCRICDECCCKIAMVAISQLRQDMFLRISFKKLRFIDPRAKRSAVPLEGMAKRRSSAHVLTSDCTGAGSTDSYQQHHESTSNRAFNFQLALRARFPSAVEQTGDCSSWRIQHNAKKHPNLTEEENQEDQ
jgi:hypothetical protein